MSGLTIYYMRHGETAWSLTGQHTGKTDLPLTAHGEDQARHLRQTLERVNFSLVVTSPRQRAQRTCELAGLGEMAEVDPDLAEWDYGEYEGLKSVVIREQRPGWNIFRDGCPGGETPDQVVRRVDQLIARLRKLEGNIALFAHGQLGQVLVARWMGWPVVEGQHFSIDPASLGILGYKHRMPDQPVVQLWNYAPENFAPAS